MIMTSQLIAAAIVAAVALFGLGVTTGWIVSHRRHQLTPHQRHQLFGE